MAGGSRRHNALALRIGAARQPGCVAFQSDQKVRVLATGKATYPDVTLVCGPIEGDPAEPSGATISNPLLLVEVLSPSTEQDDRGNKWQKTTSSCRRCKSMCSSARQRPAWSDTAAFRPARGNTRMRSYWVILSSRELLRH